VNVFDEFDRSYSGRATHCESAFCFLNRSNRPAADLMRRKIEAWFAAYPTANRSDLRTRLRTEFHSAFFELLLHEVFRRLGASIQPHVPIGSKGKKPDFLVTPKGRTPVVVEATLSMDEDEEHAAQRKSLGAIYDKIDAIASPYFCLDIMEIKQPPKSQIPARRLIDFLQRELSKLDPESVFAGHAKNGTLPSLKFEHGRHLFRFKVLPRHKERWGSASGRTILAYPARIRSGGARRSLLEALTKKAKRYGRIDKPFLIAVNCLSDWGVEREEQRDALFGEVPEYVPAFANHLETRPLANGLWGSETKPKYTRVSGVIMVRTFPWDLLRCPPCLYHNPWARHPLSDFTWPFEQAVWQSGCVRYIPCAATLASVLELPEDWPGPLFGKP